MIKQKNSGLNDQLIEIDEINGYLSRLNLTLKDISDNNTTVTYIQCMNFFRMHLSLLVKHAYENLLVALKDSSNEKEQFNNIDNSFIKLFKQIVSYLNTYEQCFDETPLEDYLRKIRDGLLDDFATHFQNIRVIRENYEQFSITFYDFDKKCHDLKEKLYGNEKDDKPDITNDTLLNQDLSKECTDLLITLFDSVQQYKERPDGQDMLDLLNEVGNDIEQLNRSYNRIVQAMGEGCLSALDENNWIHHDIKWNRSYVYKKIMDPFDLNEKDNVPIDNKDIDVKQMLQYFANKITQDAFNWMVTLNNELVCTSKVVDSDLSNRICYMPIQATLHNMHNMIRNGSIISMKRTVRAILKFLSSDKQFNEAFVDKNTPETIKNFIKSGIEMCG